MNKLIVFLVCSILSVFGAPLLKNGKDLVPNQYIVVFDRNAAHDSVAAHFNKLSADFTIIETFKIGKFQGYSTQVSNKEALGQLLSMPEVAWVEADQVVKASQACSLQNGATWGLDRIGERDVFLDGKYNYETGAGASVDAYIVDTGILTTHTDFGGRAIWGTNTADTTNADCNGHGTHVAGTVGGSSWGVAKKTTLIAVKVLNCGGSGTWTGVIKGIEWTVTSQQQRGRPSVANMSLGGGKSAAVDAAVEAAVAAGITYVVAAGNSNDDACDYSPAGTPSAISVGATTVSGEEGTEVDARSYFSNWGQCVDVFAPGELITSAWIGSNTATLTISGTSMASPHVCGVTALFVDQNPSTSPADVKTWIVSQATQNKIDMECTGACAQSPNLLAYSAC